MGRIPDHSAHSLHLPRSWGGFIVGLTGVALLSLISGILSHPRVLRDAFHLRLGGSRRLQEADLHNRLGVWALPFHVIVSLTGALLGLSTIIVGALAMLLYRGDTGGFTPCCCPQASGRCPRGALARHCRDAGHGACPCAIRHAAHDDHHPHGPPRRQCLAQRHPA
jgi:hypothetical protein